MMSQRSSNFAVRLAAASIILLSAVSARGHDVLVPCPSGMVDSAMDIQNALFATRDGGTVHLGACTYYLAQAVVARWNHHGTIRGQGKELTFIEILPGHKIDGVFISAADLSLATLFLFENPEHGDITIADLAIIVTDPEPAGLQDDPPGLPGWWRGALSDLIVVTGPEVKANIDRSSFRGAQGNFFGFNLAHISQFSNAPEPMVGKITVSNNEFENSFVSVNFFNVVNGRIRIHDNTFTNTNSGPWVEECSNCSIHVNRNHIEEVQSAGVRLIGNPSLEPSRYFVNRNWISSSQFGTGGIVVIGDVRNCRIADNDVELTGGSSVGIVLWGGSRCGIRRNQVQSDRFGFWIEWGVYFHEDSIQLLPANGNHVANNNVFANDTAIYLGAYARNNRLIRNNAVAGVQDYFLGGPEEASFAVFGPASGNRIVTDSWSSVTDMSGCTNVGSCMQTDEDGDGSLDEDAINRVDDDSDGLIDEDAMQVPNKIRLRRAADEDDD